MVRTRWFEIVVIWFHSFCCCSLYLNSFIRQKWSIFSTMPIVWLTNRRRWITFHYEIIICEFKYYIYSCNEWNAAHVHQVHRTLSSTIIWSCQAVLLIWPPNYILYFILYLDRFDRILITIEATATKEKTKNFKWIRFLGKTQKWAESVNFMNFSLLSYESRDWDNIKDQGTEHPEKHSINNWVRMQNFLLHFS